MDCEKCEPLLLDELYEELDEVTSAAVKRHVSGCARCANVLGGMRSTRRLAAMPMLDMPEGLEDRILASVKEAQKVVPIQSRASRALSWAGSWAMRPQTAMAAVFLLMIGTSAFVIRSRHSSSSFSGGAESVSVTEQGMPAGPSAPPDDLDSLDNKAAAAAHGAHVPPPAATPPLATATSAVAMNGDPSVAGPMDGLTGGKGRGSKADESNPLGSALDRRDDLAKDKQEGQAGAEKKTARGPAAPPSEIGNAAAPAGAPNQEYAPRAQTVTPPATRTQGQEPQDGFSAGMAAYRARNFPEATRQFDVAARSGDQNAALWAAKSVKDGNGGCGPAIPRFDAVAQRSSGTWLGHEATLESARCQIALGQLDAARAKLATLSGVPSHAQSAQQALNELNQVASRREAERAKAGGGGTTGASRPAAPVRAPAKPAATAVDQANGY